MAGNDKVEVRGGGDLDGAVFQNAASEATLKELVRVLSAKGGKASGDEAMRLHKKTIDENIVAIDRVSNRQDVYNKLLKDSNDKVKTFGTELSNATSKIVGGIFSTTISLAATGLQTLVGFLTNSVDQFRDLSNTGASFNNNMIEMRRAAASANMSMDEFTKAIKGNSTFLGGFGGTITEGAKRFGEISKSLRSGNIGEELFSMGYSVNSINEGLGGYLELQTKLGRSEMKDQKAMVAGSAEYLRQLDLLAKVTGQSREELAKSIQKQTADIRLNSIMQNLSGKQLADFNATVEMMDKSLPKNMSDGIKDLMDGRPDTPMGRALSRIAPGIAEYAKRMAQDGGGGIEEFQKVIKAAAPSLEKLTKQYGKNADAIRKIGDEDLTALLDLAEASGQVNIIAGMNVEAMKAEQGRRNALTTGMNSLENAFNLIKNTIIDKLLGSKLFEKLESAMGKFVTQFTQPGGFADKIANFFDTIITSFDSDLTQKGLGAAITNLFAKVAPIIGDLAKSAMRMIVEGFTGASDKRAKLLEQRHQLSDESTPLGRAARVTGKKDQAIADIDRQLEEMDKANPFDGLMGGLTSFLGGLFDLKTLLIGGGAIIGGIFALNLALGALSGGVAALANPASLVGLGALTLAIIGIGKGLELASPAVTAFATLVEKTFNGISAVISSMVDGFKAIPEVLKGIAEVDAGNIFKVGGALLTSLAPGLAAMAVGGILTLISGNAISNLATSLTSFNTIDPQKMYDVSPAIKELAGALRVLSGGDQGFLSSLGSAFSNLVKGDSGIGAFADSLKKFNTVDSTNIRNIVNAIGDVKTTIGSDFAAQAASIDTFRTSITNLNKELKVLADRLNDLPRESRGEAMAAFRTSQGQGGTRPGAPQPITSGTTPLEELNTSMTQLVTIARELNETNKDQLKFLKEKPGQAV